MKKWMAGVGATAVCVFALAGCATNNNSTSMNTSNLSEARTVAQPNLLHQVKASGVLKIGTEGTYAPFDFHDASGKLTGFDIDIATEVAKRLGVKPDFVQGQWDGLFAGLNDKRFDVLGDEVAITPDREKQYLFSTPYISSHAVLIVRKNNTTIHSFKDLKGKKAGETLTSNLTQIAKSHEAQIVATSGFNESVSLLESGRIDATVNDELSWLDLKKHNPNVPLKVVATYSAASHNAFMFRKGSGPLVKAVDKALNGMVKDGTYLKISKKWFGTNVLH